MKQEKKWLRRLLGVAAAAVLGTTSLCGTLSAWADLAPVADRGDVNLDAKVSVADVVALEKALLGIAPLQQNAFMGDIADLNEDGQINGFDLAALRQCVLGVRELSTVYGETDGETTDPTVTTTATTATTTQTTASRTTESRRTQPTTTAAAYETTTTTTTTTTTAKATTTKESTTTTAATTETAATTTTNALAPFISASIYDLYGSLPSQGTANLVIFYVDFPDCTYDSAIDMTAAQVEQIAFGSENTSDANYPFESMSAFYSRSSKGEMELTGTAFRYTTKENQSAYDTDKVKLAEECYNAFKDSVDFSQYDGDGDGYIDATLFSVPTAAGDDNWWACAGAFGDDSYSVDGKKIGHIITGNCQIESTSSYRNFNSSYLHEMGHCMGLPDYYLYYSDSDYDAMNGEGGAELMDGDAFSDMGAFSKLMLGWYRENQVEVYDASQGTQTFTLYNAQTDAGNCVIIPYGSLNGTYTDSEYFVLEYTTLDANNSAVADYYWHDVPGSGVRIYHVKTDIYDNYWWKSFKYENGSEFTDTDGDGAADDQGIRLIRLVGSDTGSSIFKTGDTISSSTSGFGWYDSSENETIDPGVTITVGELSDGAYTVTISEK